MFQTVVSPREVILMHRNSGEYTEVPEGGEDHGGRAEDKPDYVISLLCV